MFRAYVMLKHDNLLDAYDQHRLQSVKQQGDAASVTANAEALRTVVAEVRKSFQVIHKRTLALPEFERKAVLIYQRKTYALHSPIVTEVRRVMRLPGGKAAIRAALGK